MLLAFAVGIGSGAPRAAIAACSPTTYTVTNSLAMGPGSLHDAITQANANTPCADIIEFAAGATSIAVNASGLPAINDQVAIDGTSQPSWSCPSGTPAPVVELNGAAFGGDGLHFVAGSSGSSVEGLVINRFGNHGIHLDHGPTGVSIKGNLIGTDITGALPGFGNAFEGVSIWASSDNTVGGTGACERNVIASNGRAGVQILSNNSTPADSNTIAGNFVGTNKAGTSALANVYGGVWLNGSSASALVRSNIIDNNVISGNAGNGVELRAVAATSLNVVSNNHIGTDLSNTLNLGNGGNGVQVGGSNNTISGGNVIANNGGDGVTVLTFTGNRVQSNSIHSNGGLGIDLGNDGVTANDGGDGDLGANDLQNFPTVTIASTSGTGTTVGATYVGQPNTFYSFEFYASPSCDSSGNGEGARVMGGGSFASISGNIGFAIALPTLAYVGEVVTATTTAITAGNTSEFSLCFTVQPCAGDLDCDSVLDGTDNCPTVHNPGAGQTTNSDSGNTAMNRPGTDTLGNACDPDDDGDGYDDTVEIGLSENPLSYCQIMRADVGGDGGVSILDISAVAASYGQTVPPAPERRKQDGDNSISILDLSKQAAVYTQNVAACAP